MEFSTLKFITIAREHIGGVTFSPVIGDKETRLEPVLPTLDIFILANKNKKNWQIRDNRFRGSKLYAYLNQFHHINFGQFVQSW